MRHSCQEPPAWGHNLLWGALWGWANSLVGAAGALGDGTAVDGPAALRGALSTYRESDVRTVTEKLLTYALGRRVEYYDQPTIRAITASSAADNYRWSTVIVEVVKSMPFQMRRSES